jgi:hypothetical protein
MGGWIDANGWHTSTFLFVKVPSTYPLGAECRGTSHFHKEDRNFVLAYFLEKNTFPTANI